MKRSVMDLWVGIFVCLGIAALVFLSLRVANLTSASRGPTYQVTAHFHELGGLKVHAVVKSAGVPVGRVTSIRLDSTSYEAEIVLAIQKRYEFPVDTSARILTSGLLGDQYIGLTPGADPDMLTDGSTLEITQSAVVLENIISRFIFDRTTTEKPQAD